MYHLRAAICLLWLSVAGSGLTWLLNFERTPGKGQLANGHWPAGAEVQLGAKRNTLVVFAHPRCPCTRATLAELNRLMARAGEDVSAQVWFYQPVNFPADWSRTALWRAAAAIPGVVARADLDGRQARLFGAETSGAVFLYGADGRLLFQGGITGGRGHEGDNAGENAIAERVAGRPVSLARSPVYGCSLAGCDTRDLP
jgi:hypothetical protein